MPSDHLPRSLFSHFSPKQHYDLIDYFGGNLFQEDKDIFDVQVVPVEWELRCREDVIRGGGAHTSFSMLRSLYLYGKVYSFDLVLAAIADGRMPEREEWTRFEVFENVPEVPRNEKGEVLKYPKELVETVPPYCNNQALPHSCFSLLEIVNICNNRIWNSSSTE